MYVWVGASEVLCHQEECKSTCTTHRSLTASQMILFAPLVEQRFPDFSLLGFLHVKRLAKKLRGYFVPKPRHQNSGLLTPELLLHSGKYGSSDMSPYQQREKKIEIIYHNNRTTATGGLWCYKLLVLPTDQTLLVMFRWHVSYQLSWIRSIVRHHERHKWMPLLNPH